MGWKETAVEAIERSAVKNPCNRVLVVPPEDYTEICKRENFNRSLTAESPNDIQGELLARDGVLKVKMDTSTESARYELAE